MYTGNAVEQDVAAPFFDYWNNLTQVYQGMSLDTYIFGGSFTNITLTENYIYNALKAKQPIVVGLKNPASAQSHAVVITAIDVYLDNGKRTPYVTYMDPDSGTMRVATLEEFNKYADRAIKVTGFDF